MNFPEFPIGTVIEQSIVWITYNFSSIFMTISLFVNAFLEQISGFLLWLPWPFIIFVFMVAGWYFSGRIFAFCTGLFLFAMGTFGLWEQGMQTLALVTVSVFFSICLGLPFGIWASRNDTIAKIMEPILHGMQTIPSFVYLIPAVMFFGIGKCGGVVAAVLFSVPYLIKLTNSGIRNVPEEIIEAARSFGSTEWQLLTKVQLPLALPDIIEGVKQTVIMALSMVIIAAMISVGGLGEPIFSSTQHLRLGIGVEAGLSVLFIAIIFDRILHGWSVKRENKIPEASTFSFKELGKSTIKTLVPKKFGQSKKYYLWQWTFNICLIFTMLFLLSLSLWMGFTSKKQQKVTIGSMTWTGSIVIEQIMKNVLEEKLNIPTKIRPLAPSLLWLALDEGSLDVHPDLWQDNWSKDFDFYVKEKQSVFAKISYKNTHEGFYISRDIAEKYKINSIFDLKGKEHIFDLNNDSKGDIWVGSLSWLVSEINVARIKGYQLNLTPLKTEPSLFLGLLKKSIAHKKPIVFYHWEPEWPTIKYDLVRLKEPPYKKDQWIYVEGRPKQSNISCAFPGSSVYIVVSKKLQKRVPKAYKFFQNWHFPIEELKILIDEIKDAAGNNKKDPKQVARDWVAKHPKIVNSWLKNIREK